MNRRLRGLLARLRDILRRGAADLEMDEELRFHIDMETDKLVRRGLPPREARRRAMTSFGGLERHRERLRHGRRVPLLEPLGDDLRFGLRALARNPGLSLVAALTIALGVGATTTVFSAVNATLLRPLPLPDVGRLVTIQERRQGMVSTGIGGMLIPYDRYQAYRDATGDVFASLAAERIVDWVSGAFSLRLPDATLALAGSLTSGNYFQTLGVRPVLGRAYTSDDAPEIVISHDLWISRFGGDSTVVGRSLGLDGHSVVVVGVAPPGFGGTSFVAGKVWAPVGFRGDDRSAWNVRMVPLGRLRAGVSRERAAAAVDALARRIPPEKATTVRSATLEPLRAVSAQGRTYLRGFLVLLLGMAVLVLLIAAANIAGIMLARGVARRREIAVRLALGAGRARIARHLLLESLLLFAAGGLAGIALACLGIAWLAHLPLPPQAPDMAFAFSPDRRVLAFALAATGLTGILAGLAPALQASRPDLVPALKAGAAGAVGGDGRTRSAFVVAQVALAVTLLLTASLFARSLRAALAADLGFDPNGVVTATIVPPRGADAAAFHDRLLQRVRALPGVEAAAWGLSAPLSGYSQGGEVHRPDAPEVSRIDAHYSIVSPAYFATLRILLLAGRGFTRRDAPGTPRAVVINQTLADRLWPHQSPLGHRLAGLPGDAVVVGVTTTGRYAVATEAPRPFVYMSSLQTPRSTMTLLVRAPGEEAATLLALAAIVHRMDPDFALELPARLEDLARAGILPQRLATRLIGAFGLAGLILAALGVYGILAYHVARRTREFGIRRALGATSRHVITCLLRRGALLAGAGCLAGTAAGAALARTIHAFLFGIHPLDPVSFSTIPLLLLTVALLASWIPSRRATAIEAIDALRSD